MRFPKSGLREQTNLLGNETESVGRTTDGCRVDVRWWCVSNGAIQFIPATSTTTPTTTTTIILRLFALTRPRAIQHVYPHTLDTRPHCLRSHPLWGDSFSLRGRAGLDWRANLNGQAILRGVHIFALIGIGPGLHEEGARGGAGRRKREYARREGAKRGEVD